MIDMLDSLSIKNKKQNVERDGFSTIAEMKAYPENWLPDVFSSVCYEDGCTYLFNRSNEIDEVTGKWRKQADFASLQEEIIRATNVENELDDEIVQEVSDRNDAISVETERAITAEEKIATDLRTNTVRAETAIGQLQDGLTSLQKATSDSINNLQTSLTSKIDNETTRASNAESSLDAKISNEVNAREAQDTSLQNKITSETTRASNAESQIDAKVDDETNRATTAEGSINSRIDSEKDALMSKISETKADITQKISTNTNSINTINDEIGDFKKITDLSLVDISTAIYSLYYSFMNGMSYKDKKLIITYRNGQTFEINLSPIITDTDIEEFKNVSDIVATEGQALAFDSATSKWTPRTFDLSQILSEAKNYTDNAVSSMAKSVAYACDEKPTCEDGVVTYKINGETKTVKLSEKGDVWFFYNTEDGVCQTVFVDNIEFTVKNSSIDTNEFVKKNQVVETFTGEETELSGIPNLKAITALYNLVKGLLALKINISDIVDNLNSDLSNVPLSANQGKVLNELITALSTGLDNHKNDINNPHQVTKAQVGLGNVDNTSDADKPVSTATQTALDNKVDKVDGKGLSTKDFTAEDKTNLDANTSNRHSHTNKSVLDNVSEIDGSMAYNGTLVGKVQGVKGENESTYRDGNVNITKANIGLGNVDNTSDADKPVSTATNTAISEAEARAKDLTNATGVLGASGGGTGKTSLVDSANALINALTTGANVPKDDDYFISQYVNGNAEDTKTYHRRPVSTLWSYIKEKISSVLGLSETGYTGTSDKTKSDENGNNIKDTYATKTINTGVDWSTVDYLGGGDNKYKCVALDSSEVSVVNIQWSSQGKQGIYITFPLPVSSSDISLDDNGYYIQGAGVWIYLDNFIRKETAFSVTVLYGTTYHFAVYYENGYEDKSTFTSQAEYRKLSSSVSNKLDIDGSNGTSAGVSALINKLSTGTATPKEDDYYVCQSVGGGTTDTVYYRRPIKALWEYIKSKISSVLGLTSTNFGGNSATATTATKADNGVHYVAGTTGYTSWASGTAYAVGDERYYSTTGFIYTCITAHTSSSSILPTNTSYWSRSATPILGGTIDVTALTVGMMIAYKIPCYGGTTSTRINLTNSEGTLLGAVQVLRNASSYTTHLPPNTIVPLTYDGTYFRWADYNSDANYTHSGIAYCSTPPATAAKVATMPNFTLSTNQRILMYLAATSTVASATLNVNSTGAKTVRISSAATTASNFTAGWWLMNYDGTYWNAVRFTISKSDVGLGNVENTALSSWTGSSNLTTCSQGTFGTFAIKSALTASDMGLTSGSTTSGYYVRLFNGLTIQWGTLAKGSDLAKGTDYDFSAVTMPKAFQDSNWSINLSISTTSGVGGVELSVVKNTTQKFTAHMYNRNTGTTIPSPVLNWIAIGYTS